MISYLKNREILFSVIAGLSLLAGFIIKITGAFTIPVSLILFINAYVFGSYYMLKKLSTTLKAFSFDIDLLMFIAAIGAAILGQWEEGALLLFLFSLGNAMEKYAMEKANRSLAALTELAPQTALLKTEDGVKEIPIENLKTGDCIVIKPFSKISADGVVIKGMSAVNQSSITGESMPCDKSALPNFDPKNISDPGIDKKHKVFSGTINGDGYMEIIAAKEAKDSTLFKLINLVHEAKKQHSKTQRFTKSFESYFVPIVLVFVLILNFAFLVIDETFSDSFYRAISVLVVSSPCALVISTPSAVLSSISRAARQGVLIKGGSPLEKLARLKALAFDKTGTLTRGEPRITDIIPLNNMDERSMMQTVLSIETNSEHPLAKAIVKEGKRMYDHIDLLEINGFKAIMGKGVSACIGNENFYLGNRTMFENGQLLPAEIDDLVSKMEESGKTCIIIKKENHYEGLIGLVDIPREESAKVIKDLKSIGVNEISMLSGDNQRVADYIGTQVGIKNVYGNLLPEDKVKMVRLLKQNKKGVAMVGDGVNDAPAMANSTVGIAMGAAGSDIALETADIALMSDSLQNLTFTIGLSRKTRNIIIQNLFISMGVIAVMIPLTLLGIASIGPAVAIHEGSTVAVVFNALRLLAYKEKDNHQ